MDDRARIEFEFAQEVSKQLLGLATGVTALTITFADTFIKRSGGDSSWLVHLAWLAFLVSIVFGVLTLGALTGVLGDRSGTTSPSVNAKNILLMGQLQAVTFLLGMALTCAYGVTTVARGA